MKKRILSLLMIMVIVFGMSGVSWGAVEDWEDGVFSGEYEIVFYEPFMSYSYYDTITLKYENGVVEGHIVTGRGDEISWVAKDPIEISSADRIEFTNIELLLNGESIAIRGMVIDDWGSMRNIKFSSNFVTSEGSSVDLSMSLNEVKESTKPSIHEISTPFTGKAVSDRGEYTLALAGYFEKELTDGTYELTLEEIKEQTISIVAYNKVNGVKRVMTQSTLEEMSVTVSGGVVTEYSIRGRVQTVSGKLDRYTAVIEQ